MKIEDHLAHAVQHIRQATIEAANLDHEKQTTLVPSLDVAQDNITGAVQEYRQLKAEEEMRRLTDAQDDPLGNREMMSPQDIEIAIDQMKWSISCIWVDYQDGAPEKLLYDAIREAIGNACRERGFKEFVRYVFDESGAREAITNRMEEVAEAVGVANEVIDEVENFDLGLEHLDG